MTYIPTDSILAGFEPVRHWYVAQEKCAFLLSYFDALLTSELFRCPGDTFILINRSVFIYLNVLCRVLYVSFSRLIPLFGKRELVFLLSSTRNYVVYFRRGILFLLVLVKGCIMLLWHSACFPLTIYPEFSQRYASKRYSFGTKR